MVKRVKITKRQLKEPDEFITLTERAFVFFNQHSKKITVAGVLVLVAVVAVVLLRMSEKKNEEEAARLFGAALETYDRRVAQTGEGANQDLKDVLAKFDEIITKFPRTSSGAMSQLYRANIYFRQNQFDEAAKAYTAFLDQAGKKRLYLCLGWEGLGHAYEGKKDYSKALEAYQKMLQSGEGYQLTEAHLNLGYCYEKLGKTKEALDSFKAFLSSDQKSFLTDVVLRKVANLEKQ